MTRGRAVDDRIFLFGWTILMLSATNKSIVHHFTVYVWRFSMKTWAEKRYKFSRLLNVWTYLVPFLAFCAIRIAADKETSEVKYLKPINDLKPWSCWQSLILSLKRAVLSHCSELSYQKENGALVPNQHLLTQRQREKGALINSRADSMQCRAGKLNSLRHDALSTDSWGTAFTRKLSKPTRKKSSEISSLYSQTCGSDCFHCKKKKAHSFQQEKITGEFMKNSLRCRLFSSDYHVLGRRMRWLMYHDWEKCTEWLTLWRMQQV